MNKKIIPINYTSRNYESIKNDLLEHARRYYSDVYKDFNQASFGSLMIDTVSYVGDILSFYLDYQANETFLDTASEYQNIIKLGRQLGYKFSSTNSTTVIHAIVFFHCFQKLRVIVVSTPISPNFLYRPYGTYQIVFHNSPCKPCT